MNSPARIARRVALAATVAVYLLLTTRFWFSIDLAWIDLRYAANLAAGHGLRFNAADPPLEAFASPLAVALGALATRLGLPPMPLLQGVGLLSGAGLLALVQDSLRHRLGVRPAVALAAVATLALSPMLGAWASGVPWALPGTLGIYALFDRWVLARDDRGGAIVTLLLLGLRQDGPIWAAAIFAVAVVARIGAHRRCELPLPAAARRPLRSALAPLLISAAVPALALFALTLVRGLVFGSPIPWAIARVDLDPIAGAVYLAASSLGVGLPILWAVSVAFPGGRARRARPLLALLLFGGIGVIALGGESEPFGRLLLPLAPFGTALLALAADQQVTVDRSGTAAWLLLFAAIFAHLPAWDVPLAPRRIRQATDLRPDTARTRTEIAEWRFTRLGISQATTLARAVADAVEPGASWTVGSPGVRGAFSGLQILDLSGLTWPEARAARTGARAPRTAFAHLQPTVLRARLLDDEATARVLEADWEADRPDYEASVIPQDSGEFLVLQRTRRP